MPSAGYDALGFISCTGTNFMVRAAALKEVGGSPTYTLTEVGLCKFSPSEGSLGTVTKSWA